MASFNSAMLPRTEGALLNIGSCYRTTSAKVTVFFVLGGEGCFVSSSLRLPVTTYDINS